MAKPTCFIIAPITTPSERVELYGGDADHCTHVIEHLLVPAAEAAGFEPIPPVAKGAELIHVEIVTRLQDATLVLCDMSGLNPNVFFELGIRTSLNRPVCVIRDETTKHTPFDMAPINNLTYSSDLSPWILPGEIKKVAAHVVESAKAQDNALWKYFGLRIAAETAESKSGADDGMELIRMELASLRQEVVKQRSRLGITDVGLPSGSRNITAEISGATEAEKSIMQGIFRKTAAQAGLRDFEVNVFPEARRVEVAARNFSARARERLETVASEFGFDVRLLLLG